jgi:hypothetical protein
MPFTQEELTNVANAALDFYYAPDGLSPLVRARHRLKAARNALKEAETELAAALEYRSQVRRMPFARRNKPWTDRADKEGLGAKFWPLVPS